MQQSKLGSVLRQLYHTERDMFRAVVSLPLSGLFQQEVVASLVASD